MQKWDSFLQEFVSNAIQSAISGVGNLGNQAENATAKFLEFARAAASVGTGGSIGPVAGSHAGGLPHVPFDGYHTILHKGEAVLPKAEATSYRKGSETRRMEAQLAERNTTVSQLVDYQRATAQTAGRTERRLQAGERR